MAKVLLITSVKSISMNYAKVFLASEHHTCVIAPSISQGIDILRKQVIDAVFCAMDAVEIDRSAMLTDMLNNPAPGRDVIPLVLITPGSILEGIAANDHALGDVAFIDAEAGDDAIISMTDRLIAR